MIPLSVPEIEGGPLSVTEEKKDWFWSILVVGCVQKHNDTQVQKVCCIHVDVNALLQLGTSLLFL